MPTEQHPLPPDTLPPGWGPADVSDGHLAYRRRQPPIELVAERTCGTNSHPSLGLGQCWELRYRHPVGELTISEPVGRVSTRQAALNGLLECMSRIHDAVDESADSHDIQAALDTVQLRGAVPDSPRPL